MTRGNAPQTKVHYKGESEDFIVFVESVQAVQDWKKDHGVGLTSVMAGHWTVFKTKQGAQGVLGEASKGDLENEFGVKSDAEAAEIILEKGDVQQSENPERQGGKNDAQGARVAH
ncbi:MAG: hypothetical protein M4579_002313 [Chaenotheca gracillima]|nr:MAG: hypothetical protein M4579_002313 [Chaenotheca gracillima]